MYSAWFCNSSLPVNDQDHEWVAMFLIDAKFPSQAQAWGDHLAKQFALRRVNETFVRSCVEDPAVYRHCIGNIPRVFDGEEASDEHIGW
jgi:hypothetical protein